MLRCCIGKYQYYRNTVFINIIIVHLLISKKLTFFNQHKPLIIQPITFYSTHSCYILLLSPSVCSHLISQLKATSFNTLPFLNNINTNSHNTRILFHLFATTIQSLSSAYISTLTKVHHSKYKHSSKQSPTFIILVRKPVYRQRIIFRTLRYRQKQLLKPKANLSDLFLPAF